jgi:alpha-L-fucosidase
MNKNNLLQLVEQKTKQGPFQANWDSLKNYLVPTWYLDAKFGIFIHWGVYCVPAFGNEWYPRNMYQQGSPEYEHHRSTYGSQDHFGYKDFIPHFTAEKFDVEAWVQLFTEAGARYVVPVAEHHDGFAMYGTVLSKWNAAQIGPRRDIIGELAAATRKHGLVFGVSSHRAEHWWFMDGGRSFPSDVQDPQYQDFYGPAVACSPETRHPAWKSKDWTPNPDSAYLEDWLARCTELVEKYQPQLFWFDWWIEQLVFEPYLQKFAAFYYNRSADWQKGVAINYKNESFPIGSAVFDVERGKLPGIRPHFWQTDTSVSYKSWGYVQNDEFKPVSGMVHDLVDIVSKNGCLLLNVGPRPDGTIPEEAVSRLRGIGKWLDVNGEAIYGTRPWEIFGEGDTPIPEGFHEKDQAVYTPQDIRFTRKGNQLYAISLGWPQEEWLVRSLGTGSSLKSETILSISLLGSDTPLSWIQANDGLHISRPAIAPCDHAFTLRISLQG